ncbi:hypothetical protein, partial [Ilyobacter sp.]|uniref:hypothetical protein n=1 Tax=Ilyobacter sp. TaxID=3100343 RepID=UPI003565B17E
MKKIYIFLFLVVVSEVFPLDYFGEIEGTQRFKSYNNSSGSLELILGAEHEEENWYSQISLRAQDDSEDPLDLYRAYVELYGDSLTFSAGRQMIVWG